ncbi:ECF transporter S component [Listeria costaricensis]|uniref:ECF transporter S component n=1 Tax=Listeria costaricensis TaxID=2026604 RepID=UPI000C08D87B|nr:ECF transporter S component [Listeria costaricensis]
MEIKNQYSRVPITTSKSITLMAILVALTVAGRLVFAFIPNVQPVTSLVLIVTLLLGGRYGLIHATLVMLVSNLLLGFGFWTIGQILGYAVIVGITAWLIRPRFAQIPLIVMALYAAFCGYLYGFIQAVMQAPLYGGDYFGVYYLAGLGFDTLHASGNFLFYLILAPILIPLLDKAFIQYSRQK